MSSVDNRVVHLQFDNKQFEAGAKTSLKTLDKLKQSMNFKDAANSMKNFQSQVNRFTLSSISNAVEQLSGRFNSMGIVGMTVIQRLTDAAINMGAAFAKAVTVQPIVDGFNEYETQINAVQTILANTKKEGTNIDQVNSALDTLNTYADKTIYNFTEMTRNIGTFTAAGVDLQTSVDSIQGIANLAAVSGSSSMQASTAMYQLSQAIAAGKVQLMDWNSVVNAGMGGQVFQDALVRTSEHLQTGAKAAIEAKGSFRESLQEGWLTTEVLTETLKQFSLNVETAEDYENAMKSLVDQGYTQEEAQNIVDMAKTAAEAATKVKTFTQLIDTLKEALGSGWAQTWRTVIGDFEESKVLWTEVSDVLSKMINDSSNARNEMLKQWADMGGRTALIDGLRAGFEALMSVVNAVSKGLENVIPPMTAEKLVDLTNKFKEFMESLKLSESDSAKLTEVVTDVGNAFKFVISIVSRVASDFANLVGKTKILDQGFIGLIYNIDQFVKSIVFSKEVQALAHAIENLYNNLVHFGEGIAEAIDFTKLFGDGVSEAGEGASLLSTILSNLVSFATTVFSTLISVFTGGIQAIVNLTSMLGSAANGITQIIITILNIVPQAVGSAVSAIATAVSEILKAIPVHEVNSMIQDTLFTVIMYNINKFIVGANTAKENASSIFDKFFEIIDKFGDVLDKVCGVLDGAKDSLKAFEASVKANVILKIAVSLGILAASLYAIGSLPIENIVAGLGAIGAMLAVIMASAIGVMAFMKKFVKSTDDLLKLTVLAVNLKQVAVALVLFAASIRIMASAVQAFGSMSLEDLAKGILGMAASVAVLVVAVNALKKLDGVAKTVAILIAFSAAMMIMGKAMQTFAGLNFRDIATGLIGIAASAAILVAATKILEKQSKGLISTALILITFAAAMDVMANAMKKYAEVDNASIVRAGGAVVALMATIVTATKAAKKLNPVQALSLVAVLATYSQVISSFADSIKKFNEVDTGSTSKAVASITVFFVLFSGFIALLKKTDMAGKMWDISAALGATAAAISAYAEAIKKLADVPIKDIIKGTIAIASGLTLMFLAIKMLPESLNVTTSASFLIVAVGLIALSNAIAKFGSIDFKDMAQGVLGLGASLAIIVSALKVMEKSSGQLAKTSASLLLMSLALAALAVPIKTFGEMDVKNLAQGLIGLAAAITIIVVACKALDRVSGSIKKSALNLLIMSGVLLALGVGLSAIMVPISQLSEYNSDKLVETLAGVGMIVLSLFALTEAINRMPTLNVKAVASIGLMVVVLTGLTGIVSQLAGIDATAAIQGATAVSELLLSCSVAMNLLNVIPISTAAKGVAAMAILIAGISAIVVAMGALAQIPGAKWIVGEGKEFLQSIGEAIGSFFGGIAGGAVGGALSSVAGTLPSVGSALSEFTSNAQPFFDSVSSLDPNIGQSISNLAAAMLMITGADILNSATEWLTGGNSMVKFGQDLAEFAPYLATFGEISKTIDGDAVTGAANAAKTLSEFANNIPREGGLLQQFIGEIDIVGFGQKIAEFAPYLQQFSDAVKNVDSTTVEASANAAKTLAEFANNLPASGGSLQEFMGDKDIAEFGSKLVLFGSSLSAYANEIKDIDADAVVASANAAQSLAELNNNLPETGGFIQDIMGEKDLGSFAANLLRLGMGMKSYAESIYGIDQGAVASSASIAQMFVDLQNALPNTGGLIDLLGGNKDLSSFANNLPILGRGIKGYSDSIEGMNTENVISSVGALKALIEATNSLENSGGISDLIDGNKNYSFFANNIGFIGAGLKAYSDSVAEVDSGKIQETAPAISALVEATNSLENSGGIGAILDGQKDYQGFASNMGAVGDGLRAFHDAVSGVSPEVVTGAARAVGDVANVVKDCAGIDTFGIQNLSDTIKNIGDMGLPNFNEALGNAAIEVSQKMYDLAASLSGSVPAVQGALDSLHSSIDSSAWAVRDSATNLAQGLIDGINNTLNGNRDSVIGTMRGICDGIVSEGESAINNGQSAFSSAGTNLMNALKNALVNGRQECISVAQNIASDLSSAIQTDNSGFYNAGLNMMEGLKNGISDGRFGAINAAISIATDALVATKNALKEQSPSKATYEMGKFYDMGLINGMESMRDKIQKLSSDIGYDALNGMQKTIDNVDFSSLSATPTITPVVNGNDLNLLNGLRTSQSVMLNAKFANMQVVDPINSLRDSIIKDNMEVINSNNQVLESINGLRNDMSSYNDNISNMETNMYVDGKKLAASIAKPMNRELGTLSKRGRL